MTAGSVGMVFLLVLPAFATNIYAFGGLMILIELFSFAVLYDAAFAMLAQKRPDETRKCITQLTLVAGFASTIFWPLSGYLVDAIGWRATQLVFAALHVLCVALHDWTTALPVTHRSPAPSGASPRRMPVAPEMSKPDALRAFQLLATGFALSGMAISAVTVHLVEILRTLATVEAAYLAAMVMGPAQVVVRVIDATAWQNRHPLFAAMFGAGAGLSSIVRGAVPAALFGASGLGLRLGRLAAIRSVLGAVAPFSLPGWRMRSPGPGRWVRP